jgi:hypothetical protein
MRTFILVTLFCLMASPAFALDSAEKRRASAHLNGAWMGPGVTPDATPGAEWRATVANNYFYDFPDAAAPSGVPVKYFIIRGLQ